jgi:cyclophilin family peptidyl-prolyl cis-trans isomerase
VRSGSKFNPAFLVLLTVAALALTACLVAPTPMPTPAQEAPLFPAETPTEPGDSTTADVESNTPMPELASTPTPQLVPLPGGGSYYQYAQPPLMTIDPQERYLATLRTTHGSITIELFASETPVTVNNFVFLAREGFYDGVIFHRVIEGFMVQTGDPLGDGTGGPGYRFQDEQFNRNYTRGKVAMANAGPNTNGSQFFIVQGTSVDLPRRYTIFGEVTEGMDVVDAIAQAEVQANPYGEMSEPLTPVSIETVQISTGPRANIQ